MNSRKGFSVMEILIAMGILATFSLMIHQFMRFGTTTTKALEGESSSLQDVNLAMTRMVKEISEARQVLYPSPGRTALASAIIGRKGSLVLFTFEPVSPGGGPPLKVAPGTKTLSPIPQPWLKIDPGVLVMHEFGLPSPGIGATLDPMGTSKVLAHKVVRAAFTTHDIREGRAPAQITILLSVANPNLRQKGEALADDDKAFDYVTTVFCRAATEIDTLW